MSQMSIASLNRRQESGEELKHDQTAKMRLSATTTRILTGREDLSEWDDEELKEGRRRDRHGNFVGAPVKVVPKALHDEMVRRTLSKANTMMRESLPAAVQVLIEIIQGKDTDDKDKLTAIKMVMDRVMGKEAMKIEISEKKRWEVALEGSIVSAIHVTEDNEAEPVFAATGRPITEVIEVEDEEDDSDPFDD
jgi:hypothetical protein